MFSLADFAEPGDRITNFTTGERYVIPGETKYSLCGGVTEDGVPCPFFVEANYDWEYDKTLAEFVHLHRGDDADEALDDHEAWPSETHTLDWWREHGPERVRERFIDA